MDTNREIQKYLDDHVGDDDLVRRAALQSLLEVGGANYLAKQAITNPKSYMALITKLVKSGPTVEVNTTNNTAVQVYMPDNGRGSPVKAQAKVIDVVPNFLDGLPATPIPRTMWDIDKEGAEVL